jgi:hypothetical protein
MESSFNYLEKPYTAILKRLGYIPEKCVVGELGRISKSVTGMDLSNFARRLRDLTFTGEDHMRITHNSFLRAQLSYNIITQERECCDASTTTEICDVQNHSYRCS